MKKYIIKCTLEKEVEAENEEEAVMAMFGEMAVENDSIENYIIAEEKK